MAEESGGESWWGAWGTEFISNVKAKSAETLSLVKQDLSEFVTTIQHDTTVTVAETAANVKEKLKVEEDETDASTTAVIRQGVSQWLGTLSTALKENVSQMTATVDEEPTNSGPVPVFDRIQARVHEIQTDASTYCNDPDGHPAHFEEWQEKFDMEQHKTEISELLVNRPEIRALYTKLVPSAVTNYLFWTRYFYRIHRFEQEEKRKAALVERANKMEEEDLGWGDDDDTWDIEDSSSKDPTQSSSSDELIRTGSTLVCESNQDDECQGHGQGQIKDTKKPSDQDTPRPSDNVDDDEVKNLHLQKDEQNEPFVEMKLGGEITAEELPKENYLDNSSEKPKSSLVLEDKLLLPDKTSSLPNNDDDDKPRQSSSPILEENPSSSSESVTTGSGEQLNRDNSSNSSVDSSWSKLSEEDLKHNNGVKTKKTDQDQQEGSSQIKAPSPSHSERSSSSLVVIPLVQEKDVIDIDWEDDDDDGFGDDVSSAKKDAIKPTEIDDDDDWENWE